MVACSGGSPGAASHESFGLYNEIKQPGNPRGYSSGGARPLRCSAKPRVWTVTFDGLYDGGTDFVNGHITIHVWAGNNRPGNIDDVTADDYEPDGDLTVIS